MRFHSNKALAMLLLLSKTETTLSQTTTTNNKDDAVFLWSSTGGGWRAMFACIGYANLFRQAGLFDSRSDDDHDHDADGSRFAQIVSTRIERGDR